MLKNALHAPTFPASLFSVRAATDENAKVVFTKDTAKLIANHTRFNIHKQGCLYYLPTVTNDTASITRSLADWHKALGHMNNEDILKLESFTREMKITETKSKQSCTTCNEHKMTKLPKSQDDPPVCYAPLERVHTHVCGPIYPVPREGYKYIINFIDEFSSMLFVYFLRFKDEASQALKKFLVHVAKIGRAHKKSAVITAENTWVKPSNKSYSITASNIPPQHHTLHIKTAKGNKSKLQQRGFPGVYLGVNPMSQGYFILNLKNQGVITTRNAHIEDIIFEKPATGVSPPQPDHLELPDTSAIKDEPNTNEKEPRLAETEENSSDANAERPRRDIRPPKRFADYYLTVNVDYAYAAVPIIPTSYEKAVNSENAKLRKAAMVAEIQTLEQNQTWDYPLCHKVEPNQKDDGYTQSNKESPKVKCNIRLDMSQKGTHKPKVSTTMRHIHQQLASHQFELYYKKLLTKVYTYIKWM
ncbi:uncharacterized protein LOC114536624 [Dendronephthya gigantea]|uniref:uncharacterized protein LOC114536624 n=1 Tax=Dendronephthya gigantea TaxID=151771 RepID=UPI00106BDD50|nr:uncharacterized protein LOC114536624 [Dendronephthya gigantea]